MTKQASMPSTRTLPALLAATLLVSIVSCGDAAPSAQPIPRIVVEGSRARDYKSLDELAEKSNAVLVVKPTGTQSAVPLPQRNGGTPESAPTLLVQVEVVRILSGSVSDDVINIVSPGIDENTGKQALLNGGPYIVFVAPAMYAANDPVGGYVIVGGPTGLFASRGAQDVFERVDSESSLLPAEVSLNATKFPKITKTEEQLLYEGP